MRDEGLKRTLHFLCGFAVGGLIGFFVTFYVLDALEPQALLTWGVVGGLVGGVAVGLAALWRLDRFWAWWAD